MIKEYIDKMSQENEEELKKHESQMKNLIGEMESTQAWLNQLQKESNVQINIFSPRTIDEDMENKLQEAQNKVSKIKQQLEYTRELIETHIKKKNEYEILLKEASNPYSEIKQYYKNEKTGNEEIENETASDIETEIKKSEVQELEREEAEESEENGSEQNRPEQTETEIKNEKENLADSELVKKMKAFVNDIYRKNEICLAFLNSDRNKCKSELLSVKKEIKEFASEIENILKK